MDQARLHNWESRCIQQERPACTAACPLHVDARAFIRHFQNDRIQDALKVICKTLPLPGILGRICDGPCQTACRRGEVGDPIQIAALERACIAHMGQPQRWLPLPDRAQTIAVVGSALSSLTAATDLLKKGYRVCLLEPGSQPAASLLARYPNRLSDAICRAELAVLKRDNFEIRLETDPSDLYLTLPTAAGFDAVYIGLDGIDPVALPQAGRLTIAPDRQTTPVTGVFAGGDSDRAHRSPVWQAAEGRWAATSIDRFLQQVSLTAGRENQGTHATRLYTNLTGIPPLPAVPMDRDGRDYSDRQACREARRCVQCECLECVKVCPYLERFGGYPKTYAREIYNNASIVMGARQANLLINSCSLCGLCEAVCPENFAMQTLCRQARRDMVDRGKMPPSAHAFALEDLAFSQSDAFALARHQPGRQHSAWLFFPGCQLCAARPSQVTALYDYLCRKLAGGVALVLGCCGAPVDWAGRAADFAAARQRLQHQWRRLGRPTVITACTTCRYMLASEASAMPLETIWETLTAIGLPNLSDGLRPSAVAIHDPCTSRAYPATQAAVRQILDDLNVAMAELPLSQSLTECYGFGGLMDNANPELARQTIQARADQSDHDFMTYCAMCSDRLAGVGKRAWHVLDLLFPEGHYADPAARPRPTGSERRDNRRHLKTELLQTLWKEPPSPMPDYRHINVLIPPDLRDLLDRRRILTEDVQQVVYHAETTGQKLIHPGTGHVKASARLHHATFWVEYAPAENGFQIYQAYAHRMTVKS